MVRKQHAIGVAVLAVALSSSIVRPLVLQLSREAPSQAVAMWSDMWYGDESVRAGTVMARGNTQFSIIGYVLPWAQTWRRLKYAAMALIGEVYLASFMKVADLDFFKESDPEGQFCRSLLDYFWVIPLHPANRGTRQDMKEFVECCRAEWPQLSPDELAILGPLRAKGAVPLELLLPLQEDQGLRMRRAREPGPPPYAAEKLTRPELEDLLATSMRKSTWEGVVPEVPKSALAYYESLDLRRLPMIAADWKEVARAIQEGRIAGFDATPLLPKELFNATPAVLAAREGEAARTTPVHSDGCTAIGLDDWGRLMEERRLRDARVSFNLADTLTMAYQPLPDVSEEQRRAIESRKGVAVDYCDTGYINTRRMPRFQASLPDVPKMLGMEEDILRVESYLWMGALRGGFHYDEEANLYVQLVGEADVWLIPQNYTIPATGGARISNPPTQQVLEHDPFWKQVPFHVFRIGPGQGVTFPASTYHLFCAQSPERVAINFFFIPKWRRMEYHAADWYHQEAARPGGVQRLALRQLWARTFARLWDERGRSLIWNAGKNELL